MIKKFKIQKIFNIFNKKKIKFSYQNNPKNNKIVVKKIKLKIKNRRNNYIIGNIYLMMVLIM